MTLRTAGDSRLLTKHDMIFWFINIRALLILIGCLELLISLYLVLGRNPVRKLAAVRWISYSFRAYGVALLWFGVQTPCECLGTLTGRLPFSRAGLILV